MVDIENIAIERLKKKLLRFDSIHSSYNYISIATASSEKIKKWAQRQISNGTIIGEVLSADTIDYKSGNPVPFGLFCEQIFGPTKNYTCRCGKYSGIFHLKTCEQCHVELTDSRVRRYRMGYTELISPVAHPWYLGERSNYIGFLLNDPSEKLITTQTLKKLIYYRSLTQDQEKELERFLDNDAYQNLIEKREELENILENFLTTSSSQKSTDTISKINPLKKKKKKFRENSIYKLKNSNKEKDFVKNFFRKRSYLPIDSIELENSFTKPWFKEKIGSEFLKSILEDINLTKEIKYYRKAIRFAFYKRNNLNFLINSDQKLKFYLQKLRILESFFLTKTNPGNVILTTLPILPPTLRPFFEGENGTLISSDINSAYRLIITQNNNLATQLFGIGFLSFLVTEMRRKLQESVDCLIENSQKKSKNLGLNDQKRSKGLLEILEGKYGHFRQYLLGKRVDYSARSVIISAPGLRFNQCGLPYDILLKLFQPQILKKLVNIGNFFGFEFLDLQLALMAITKKKPFLFTLIKKLTRNKKILLNRAPTLHRYGIQSFEILVTLNKSIHLHPLVCGGFNADFDGDQMGIHLPLFEVTQMEASQLMKSSSNFFSLANSDCIIKPTQDMVMGCYYLTFQNSKQNQKKLKWFSSPDNAIQYFLQKKITLHYPILVNNSQLIKNFDIRKDSLYFFESLMSTTSKKIEIIKLYKSNHLQKSIYFFTNLGILRAIQKSTQSYKIEGFFAQTTVGRILFEKNLEKMVKEFKI